MLTLAYEPAPDLPRLLWVAWLDRRSDVVTVRHGPWIETAPTWFGEGAWNGEFAQGAPTQASVLAGTAAELRGGEFVIATPTHTLDRIHTIVTRGRFHASNSLALLLAASGEQCDLRYRHYMDDFASIRFGLRAHRTNVPTRSGNRVNLHYHCNLRVDAEFGVRAEPKPQPPLHGDYRSYRERLSTAVQAVVANAGSKGRRVAYEPLVGISSGYDSPACAVLAREAGCRDAYTFRRARPGKDISDDDSGEAIGERLGFRMHFVDRDDYLARADSPEIEFLASGTGGDLAMLCSIEALLERRIVLTGDHGDRAWDPNSPWVSREIKRGDPGSSLVDFRGRVGFLMLPVPFIDIVGHPHIHEISRSAEMRPWSLGRDHYDRPIPRRIAEDAGVPRDAFGQSKRAVALTFRPTTGEHEPLDALLSPVSLAEFRAYYDALPARVKRRGAWVSRLMRGALWVNVHLNWKFAALARRFGLPGHTRIWVPSRYHLAPAPHDFTFHWAIEKLTARYRNGLDSNKA